jgi:diguanylate cyclase (GGDEF)-like protein
LRRSVDAQTPTAAFEASGAAIFAVDLHGEMTTHNARFLELWEMPEALMHPPATREDRIAHIAAQAAEGHQMAGRWKEILAHPDKHSLDVFELKDGRSIECTSEPQRLGGRVVGRVWSFRDVTYQRRIEQELRQIAFKDALTGLYNRRRAEETLAAEIERARRTDQPLSVAILDIDHFKRINDAHGHQAGDDVLKELARDVRKRLRATDAACRWGGEEFLLILPATDVAGAAKAIDQLRRYLGRERRSVPTFTVSCGIAQYDGNARRADAMVSAADAKLYEAKASGRNRVCA